MTDRAISVPEVVRIVARNAGVAPWLDGLSVLVTALKWDWPVTACAPQAQAPKRSGPKRSPATGRPPS